MRKQKSSDNSVSPVIGIILMVAITLLLSAIVGIFALGFSSNTNEVPKDIGFSVSEVREGPSGSQDEVMVYLVKGGDLKNNEIYFSFENVKIQHEEGPSVSGTKERLSWRELDVNAPPIESAGEEISVGSKVGFEPPDGFHSVEDRKVNIIYDNGKTEKIIYVLGPLSDP